MMALDVFDAEGSVDELYNKERATVSLGYIGLYEVATTFYGPLWEIILKLKLLQLKL
ncbi:hypothetical protein LMG8526HA_00643 [Lactococcus lactis]|nr:hypothetical protein [Lactococcus lactis]